MSLGKRSEKRMKRWCERKMTRKVGEANTFSLRLKEKVRVWVQTHKTWEWIASQTPWVASFFLNQHPFQSLTMLWMGESHENGSQCEGEGVHSMKPGQMEAKSVRNRLLGEDANRKSLKWAADLILMRLAFTFFCSPGLRMGESDGIC